MERNTLQWQKASSALLSLFSIAGVAITAVASAKATTKAVKLIERDSRRNHDGDQYAYATQEAIQSAWKCYIPAALIGVSTIACILGANVLSKKQQAALTSAYALVNSSYKQYKDKLKELFGQETHNAVMDAIVKEKCEETHITAESMLEETTFDFDVNDDPEIVRTFYDSYSERYFKSSISKVIEAEYHLNRNYALGNEVTLNDFYKFIGLSDVEYGDAIGWSGYEIDEMLWIDFNHRRTILDDGMEIFIIEMIFDPVPLESE